MVPITWIFDASIVDRLSSGTKKIHQVAHDLGHHTYMVDRNENGSFTPPDIQGPTVLYGSHLFVRNISDGRYQPGALGVNDRTQVLQYLSNLPIEWFLNHDGNFTSWAVFKHKAHSLFDELGSDDLFIRPNSGFKTFSGQVLKRENCEHEISSLDQLSSVMNDTLMLYKAAQKLQGEFRFVIADKQVIAGSEYRWDNILDIRRDWPQECWDLAQQVANHDWQVDVAYTCDVALTDSGPKVIELNGFSCAGLYACDLTAVVNGVSEAALKEYLGDGL